MKKKILLFLALILLPISINAKEKVTLYLFHGDGCPHCADEIKFLDDIDGKYDIDIVKYEVWNNDDNNVLMSGLKEKIGVPGGVPFTIIGTDWYLGYTDSVGKKMISSIEKFSESDYIDVVKMYQNNEDISNIEFNKSDDPIDSTIKEISIFGKIYKFDAKKVSLPIISIIIGFVDGFNPCSMWVLLFLIGMLINMKDRKRMWILGITFLATSAIVYLVMMSMVYGIALSLSTKKIIRLIISIVALIAGGINIYNFIQDVKKPSGCTVVDEKKRSKIFKKIKSIVSEKNFIVALVGIIALAVSINMIELACSVGLPVLFINVLALNNITTIEYILYMFLYILFYLIDDIVIFVIAMVTLNIKGISGKYSKYSHLIGGIIMILIGILMIFKPGWLMFNFN